MSKVILKIISIVLIIIVLGILLLNVKVNNVEVDSINLNNSSYSMYTGDITVLVATISPSNATNKTVSWESSDSSIVTVSSNGIVFGVKEGIAIVTAASNNGKKATCIVSVIPKVVDVTSVSLNKTEANIVVGNIVNLTATISPSDATNKMVIWKSSDETVATVNSNGVVTGVKAGMAIITATSNNGKKATCTVNVSVNVKPYIDKNHISKDYKLIAEYDGSTLKYWIENGTRKGGKWYGETIAHIWAKDPYNQLKVALTPTFGELASAENIINNEINKNGYLNKALVTVNASGFVSSAYSDWLYRGQEFSIPEWKHTSVNPVVINDGKVVRNFLNQPLPNPLYVTHGLGKDGWLKEYTFKPGSGYVESNKAVYNKMINDGIKYTFGFSGIIYDSNRDWLWPSYDAGSAYRTAICQIDENNFILISTGSVTLTTLAQNMRDHLGCKFAYNLDGGGSRKMFYKLPSSKSTVKLVGDSRLISDMVYFVE